MTSRMRVRLAKLATLLGGATLLWACNAPPIVVPPPYTPDVVFTSKLLTDASGQQTMMVFARGISRPLSTILVARRTSASPSTKLIIRSSISSAGNLP